MPPPGVCVRIINDRQKIKGFGTMANPEIFLNQDFQQLKQYCLVQRLRYIDEMFPPDKNSIGQGVLSPDDLHRVEWKRPGKLVSRPSFTIDGVSRFDFGQGVIGDCWFLAAIGALTFQKEILAQEMLGMLPGTDGHILTMIQKRSWNLDKFEIFGVRVSDEMLNLMGLRYSNTAGFITLESFISLALRFKCMSQIFKLISNGNSMTLRESEWLYLSMYS